MGCLGEIQDKAGNRISTPSAPPAWHWLDECEVPVQVYQHLTSETPKAPDSATFSKQSGGEALSADSCNLSDAATLGVQNDSPDPTYQDCWPSERYPSDGPDDRTPESAWSWRVDPWRATVKEPLTVDQCSECRCAPGQPHATGCDEAAKVTDAQSNAVETYVFPEIGQFPGQETGVEEETHEDLQGKDADSFVVASCPECGAVADIDYGTVGDKPLDCRAHGEPTLAALMAEGYREMAEDSLAMAEANLPPDCRDCEPEPARSAIGAGPVFGSRFDSCDPDGVRYAYETPRNFRVGARSEHVPFSVQSWMFESLCEGAIENLQCLIEDHHDLIIEMARDRFRKGYAKYGSAMYSWSPERRLDETLQELADATVYLTSGTME